VIANFSTWVMVFYFGIVLPILGIVPSSIDILLDCLPWNEFIILIG